jgi:hypothetical protein
LLATIDWKKQWRTPVIVPFQRPWYLRLPPFVLFAVGFLVGCGSGTGTVSGKLTVGGRPVTTGANIVFIGPTGQQGQAMVERDGTFQMDHAPTGRVEVTVVNAPLPGDSEETRVLTPDEMLKAKKAGTARVKGRQIPRKYETPNNGLTYDVTSGHNTIDIDLAP